MALKNLAWLIAVTHCVSGSLQFLSRPDLSPPRLNITVPASPQTEAGYLFFTAARGNTPDSAGPDQPGAYIFRDNGELVWSGVGYWAGWVADFSPSIVNGKPTLRAFQGDVFPATGRMLGNHALLANSYRTISVIHAATHRLSSAHEFEVVNESSVLIETPIMTVADLSSYGGNKDQKFLLEGGFQEMDLKTGEPIFEWSSRGRINPIYSAIPLDRKGTYDGRTYNSAWNYFHINSIDKDSEGDYLVSARHYNAIFKINGSNGGIIWQLGGMKGSTFKIPSNLEFAFQHDARFQYRSPNGEIEHISFFDNAAYSVPGREIAPCSRGRHIELNNTAKSLKEIQTYHAPDNLIAHTQGSFRFLPNGNKLANWGSAGALTEFADDGTILFHAYLDSYPNKNVQSYRGFKANWTAFPSEEPAVLALRSGEKDAVVWVSWNGDTETKTWKFYLIDKQSGENHFLSSVQRSGFETRLEATIFPTAFTNHGELLVVAEALDHNGNSLRKSRPVEFTADEAYQDILEIRRARGRSKSAMSSKRLEL
ncbi:ASST-domain-containing protein [Penicillium waksmanii]|uniref:ASST-domain-containing protein n=1 Tax=Penicillium waksmanii TaxID=69791 RepID=UPI0025482268|nr:ASST-domain-containing protein [Penicillium waksmanii]KAJ5995150.1 ASST-domain-containing protein [Penicillium waksmanii]